MGSTQHLAAENLSGIAKNGFKNTLPVLARQKVQAEAPVCVLSTAVHGLLKFPWCTCQSAAMLSMSGWERGERQQNSMRFKSMEDKHHSWTFSKDFCTVISSQKVRNIPCSPSVQLALHISTDSLCNLWSDFSWGNSCPTVRYYCPHHFIGKTNMSQWLWNRAQKYWACSSEKNHSGQLRKPCTIQ